MPKNQSYNDLFKMNAKHFIAIFFAIIISIGTAHDLSFIMDFELENIELCDSETEKDIEEKEKEPNYTTTLTDFKVTYLDIKNLANRFALFSTFVFRKIPTPPPDYL